MGRIEKDVLEKMNRGGVDKVREFYERNALFEDRRLPGNDFEMAVTLSFINRYVRPGEKILDVSCGTGRYAMTLLDEGYLMGLNDLSAKNMELTFQKTDNHPGILHIDISDALNSDIRAKRIVDACCKYLVIKKLLWLKTKTGGQTIF